MSLTAYMRAAIHYIALHPTTTRVGCLPLGTIKALEKRGLVTSHSSGYMNPPGEIGHFLTDEGKKVALRIAAENRKAARESTSGEEFRK